MRKVLTLMMVISMLAAVGWILNSAVAFASPEDAPSGNTTDCLVCHKGDPTGIDAEGNATKLYMAAHDSSVGECMTCHEVPNESIHGQWNDTPESCARCHRTHTALNDFLLTMGKDELCEFCHGHEAGLAQTNVLDGVLRMNGQPLRGGGFENAKMNTAAYGNLAELGYPTNTSWGNLTSLEWKFPVGNTTASKDVTSTHSLEEEAVIWGSGAISSTPDAGDMTELECVSCHDPHIYGLTYRMLKKNPEGGAEASGTLGKLVTDQLTFFKYNPGNTTILSYTTDDYSNTVIYNKTWDSDSGNWTLTPLLITVGSNKYPTSYAAPKVLNSDGTAVKVYYESGSSWSSRDMYSDQLIKWCTSCHDRYYTPKGLSRVDTGDAIYKFGHRVGDTPVVWNSSTNRWETSPSTTSYGSSSSAPGNVRYNCMVCHTAHGTTAFMTEMVQAEPWPGQGGGAYDTLDDGTKLGEGWLAEDTSLGDGNFTDHDGDSRSNLLRLDNRGVCQSCHQIGKSNYLTKTLR